MKLLAAFIAATTYGLVNLGVGLAQAPTTASLAPKSVSDVTEPVNAEIVPLIDWEQYRVKRLLAEFAGVRIPSYRYLLAVAQCETGVNPAHIGNTKAGHTYRGAFGFYTEQGGRGGTFDQWGGWQFARYANEADYWEQVVVFLRAHITGFYDYRVGKWWPPAGLSVNNCSRYAAPLDWIIG